MNSEIRNEQKFIVIDEDEVHQLCEFLGLRFERDQNELLSLYFVDNKKIREINKEYLSHDFETDVISFPMNESGLLGDIVVSAEQAIIQKSEYSEKEELYFLIIHGFLHLLGYEDYSEDDRREMLALGKSLLEEYKVKYGE